MSDGPGSPAEPGLPGADHRLCPVGHRGAWRRPPKRSWRPSSGSAGGGRDEQRDGGHRILRERRVRGRPTLAPADSRREGCGDPERPGDSPGPGQRAGASSCRSGVARSRRRPRRPRRRRRRTGRGRATGRRRRSSATSAPAPATRTAIHQRAEPPARRSPSASGTAPTTTAAGPPRRAGTDHSAGAPATSAVTSPTAPKATSRPAPVRAIARGRSGRARSGPAAEPPSPSRATTSGDGAERSRRPGSSANPGEVRDRAVRSLDGPDELGGHGGGQQDAGGDGGAARPAVGGGVARS